MLKLAVTDDGIELLNYQTYTPYVFTYISSLRQEQIEEKTGLKLTLTTDRDIKMIFQSRKKHMLQFANPLKSGYKYPFSEGILYLGSYSSRIQPNNPHIDTYQTSIDIYNRILTYQKPRPTNTPKNNLAAALFELEKVEKARLKGNDFEIEINHIVMYSISSVYRSLNKTKIIEVAFSVDAGVVCKYWLHDIDTSDIDKLVFEDCLGLLEFGIYYEIDFFVSRAVFSIYKFLTDKDNVLLLLTKEFPKNVTYPIAKFCTRIGIVALFSEEEQQTFSQSFLLAFLKISNLIK